MKLAAGLEEEWAQKDDLLLREPRQGKYRLQVVAIQSGCLAGGRSLRILYLIAQSYTPRRRSQAENIKNSAAARLGGTGGGLRAGKGVNLP